jgi:hypothetical protein
MRTVAVDIGKMLRPLIITMRSIIDKRYKKALEGALEPPTLWLTATRSNQLSYSSTLSDVENPAYSKIYIAVRVPVDKLLLLGISLVKKSVLST